MKIEKELSEISWQVDEPTYRNDPALSQSTLGTYEKLGFNGLEHLFDRKESPSLTFGSCVDSILTGGEDEFNERFTVLDINITDGGMNVVNQLLSMKLPYTEFEFIPQDVVSDAAKEAGFWKDPKWDKRRYSEVLKTGNIADYYTASMNSDKTIITQKTFEEVLACVKALRESPGTKNYFAEDDIFSPVRRYYQLKFKGCFDGVEYRGMMDLLIVDYEHKIIYPCDLKTSSHQTWDFEESFIQWGYNWQARLYWRLIRANLDNDPYFKDFKLEDFRFIVINKNSLIPLVWKFPLTQALGTLVDDEGNEYRDPYEIGKELKHYLDTKPIVPDGIKTEGLNIIGCLHKK